MEMDMQNDLFIRGLQIDWNMIEAESYLRQADRLIYSYGSKTSGFDCQYYRSDCSLSFLQKDDR